jgi:DNA-directed RNA polymerase specialized sigma subunit
MTNEEINALSQEIRRLQAEVHRLEQRRNEIVLTLLAEGRTQRQIALATGLSPGRIGQIAMKGATK